MKGITIGGIDYLPASRLAKEFKYTSDYIGQLCRAKKVDAQLVGRSWYVNPTSLSDHKSGRYNKAATPKAKTKVSKDTEAVEVKINRIAVNAPVTKNAIRMSTRTENTNFAKRVVWKPIKYENDEGALYPQIKEEIPDARIPVKLAGSTEITISKATKSTNLVAEPLPEVSLKGKIKIHSLDHDDEDEETLGDIPLPQIETAPVSAIHHSLPHRRNSRSNDKQLITMTRAVKPTVVEREVRQTVVSRTRFAPESVNTDESDSEEVSFEYVRVTLLTTAGVLTVCLLGLFFSESSVSATSGSYTWGIDFSIQSLSALVSLFSR